LSYNKTTDTLTTKILQLGLAGDPIILGQEGSASPVYLTLSGGGVAGLHIYKYNETPGINFTSLKLWWTPNEWRIDATNAGTHTAQPLRINGSSQLALVAMQGDVQFDSAVNGNIFKLNGTTGHVQWNTDNTYDFGTSANRPRSISAGTDVISGRFVHFGATAAGTPAAGDCDADAERGRLTIDTTNNLLYVCNGATRVWDSVALTN
jgi:hypothetical protein